MLVRSQDVLAGAQWSSRADPNTGKTYYYHQMTNETTWEKPLAMINYEAHMLADPSAMEAGMVGSGVLGMPGSMPGSGLVLTGSTAGVYGGQSAIARFPTGTEMNANNVVA
eukprot:707671_1